MNDHRLDALIRPMLNEWIDFRRQLHQYPELSYPEHETANRITEVLEGWGLNPRRLAGTGVIADIGTGSETVVALRADIDALPVEELNTFSHRSKNPGLMHACGHDGHIATLLCATNVLVHQQDKLDEGRVRVLFQPAEEGGAGAKKMIDEGALEGVDRIYGLHNWPANAFGTVGITPGPIMAASSIFELDIRGRGGHGSQPQNTNDPIVAAVQVVNALQTLVSRELDPRDAAVLSVCTICGGTAKNIIPDQVTLSGTIRGLSDDMTDRLGYRMSKVASAVANALGCAAETHYERQYPAVVNHAAEAQLIIEVATELLGESSAICDGLPVMGAEDFSFYLKEIPGAFFFLGAAREGVDCPQLHQSTYDFNDDLIPVGAKVFLRLVERRLNRLFT